MNASSTAFLITTIICWPNFVLLAFLLLRFLQYDVFGGEGAIATTTTEETIMGTKERSADVNTGRTDDLDRKGRDSNPDAITGAPGSHPVGTGVGAAAGAAAGAAIGTIVPGVGNAVGAIAGGIIGAVGGGLAGKGVAEQIDPTAEDAYWRENYTSRPYASSDYTYDDYAPAYRYGWESRSRYAGRDYNTAESELERGWENAKGKSRLGWDKAKMATKDAWRRVESALPGDADRDGR